MQNWAYRKIIKTLISRVGLPLRIALSFVIASIGYWGVSSVSEVTAFKDVRTMLLASASFSDGNDSEQTEPIPLQTETGVEGTGEIITSRELVLSAAISGVVSRVDVASGEIVEIQGVILRLEDREARAAFNSAETELASARLELDLFDKPDGEKSNREQEIRSDKADVLQSYEDSFTAVTNAFLDLPRIREGLRDVLYGKDVSASEDQENIFAYSDMVAAAYPDVSRFRTRAEEKYKDAHVSLIASSNLYQDASRASSPKEIEELLYATLETAKSMSSAVKSSREFLDFVKNALLGGGREIPLVVGEHGDSLTEFASSANDRTASLLDATSAIRESADALAGSEKSLDSLLERDVSLDRKELELNVSALEHVVRERESYLAQHVVRAPFSGKIADLAVEGGNFVEEGETVATLISTRNLAKITLNEADVLNVRLGDVASLFFSGDRRQRGVVRDIDAKGVKVDGIVTYGVIIQLDEYDERVRPGMSVTASIATQLIQH